MAYPTVDECKAFSDGIVEVTGASDDAITGQINAAKNLIHIYCKQDFEENDLETTKKFNGNDSDSIDLLPRCYSLTSVIDSGYDFTDIIELKYGNNYSYLEAIENINDLGPRYRLRDTQKLYNKTFVYGTNNIEVTGDWGWSSVPDDIKNICMELVERLMIKRLDVRQYASPFSSERTPDGYSYQRDDKLSAIFDFEIKIRMNKYVWQPISIERI